MNKAEKIKKLKSDYGLSLKDACRQISFEELKPGAFVWSDWQGDYFIKPAQDKKYHMDSMMVNLYNGNLIHYSHLHYMELKDKKEFNLN